MMNLFNREIKKNFKSFLIWLIILVAVNGFMLAAFGTVSDIAKDTEKLLSQYPEAFVKAMSLDKFDMTNILHYFASRSYIMVTIFGSIYAVMFSSSILSKEESAKTIEFLISKPLTRNEIVTSKYLCVISYTCLFNLLFSFSNYGLMMIFKTSNFEVQPFLLISIGAFLIHLVFASIVFFISVFITNTKAVISVSFGVVFITYFFSILSSLKENLSFFRFLSPFSYYGAEDLAVKASINNIYLLISISVIFITTILTYIFYSKKDITA